MIDQSSLAQINKSNPTTPTPSLVLPDTLDRFSQNMAERVESPDMIDILSTTNPQLVMEFQEDVVVIQKLPRLTRILLI